MQHFYFHLILSRVAKKFFSFNKYLSCNLFMTITNADSTTKQKIFLVCFILDSTSSVSSSSCVDLRSENFYKNKERNKTNVSEAHFSNIKNNGDINSKSFSKHSKQQGRENKAKEESYKTNIKTPRSFALQSFQSIKPSSNTSKDTKRLEKRKTARSTKVDSASTVLALYGADIDYKGNKKMSSECIVQPRVSFTKN